MKTPQADKFLDTKHLSSGLKKRALVGAGFSVSAQTISYGIQTVGTIIMARILTPEAFGLVSMAMMFSLIARNFGLNGFTEAIIQRDKLTHYELSKLFWVNLLIMLGLTVVFVALSPLFAWFFREPQLTPVSMVMALTIIFGGLSTCHMALLNRNMNFKEASFAHVLDGLISTGIGIVLALQGFGVWALVIRRVSSSLGLSILSWLFCRWRPGIPAKGTDIKPLLSFGYRTYGNFLLIYVRNNLDKILVGKVFGKTSLGHYDRSSQLSSLLPTQLVLGLSGVGISTLSRLRDDPPRYRAYFAKALSVLSFLGFPGSVLFTLLGKDIIILLLGDKWSVAGQIFMALGPGIGVFVIYNTNVWLHVSLGRADRLMKWSILVLATSAVSYSVGLLFGPVGVAVAYSIMFYVLLFPSLAYAGSPAGIKVSFYFAHLWKYWASAFAAGGIYWVIFNLFPPMAVFYRDIGALAKIGLGSVLYAVLYLAVLAILFRGFKPLLMFLSLIKDMLGR